MLDWKSTNFVSGISLILLLTLATGLQAQSCDNYDQTMVLSAVEPSVGGTDNILIEGTVGVTFSGTILRVLDLGTPTVPAIGGQLPLSGAIADIALDGDIVFALLTNGRLVTVDINPPIMIHELDSLDLGGVGLAVELHGDLAIILDASGDVQVVDANDPADLLARGTVVSNADPRDLALVGDHALVTSEHGVTTLDLTDPDSPANLGLWSTGIPGNSWPTEEPTFGEISVSGDRAAVICRQWGIYEDPWGGSMPVLVDHIAVLDVSDPASVDYVSWVQGFADHVQVDGDLVYLTSDYLNTVSIHTAAGLTLQGKVHTDFEPGGLALSGSNLFVGAKAGGLAVFDVTYSNSVSPLVLYAPDEYQMGGSGRYSFSWWIDWSGHFSSYGYKIWDLSNPLVPEVRVSGGGGGMWAEPYYGLYDVEGDLFCYSIGSSEGPSVPVICDMSQDPVYSKSLSDYYNAYSVQLVGDVAWIVTEEPTLVAVDISNLETPVVLSTTPLFWSTLIVEPGGAFFYTRSPNTITPVDLSNPAAPLIGTTIPLPSILRTNVVRDGLVFAGTETSGLVIIDIHDVMAPSVVGLFPQPTITRGIQLNGDLVLMVQEDGFQVVSVVDPEVPSAASPFVGINEPRGKAVWLGDRLFISEVSGDLEMWDMSDLDLPVLAGSAMGLGKDVYLGEDCLVIPGGIFPLDCEGLVPVEDETESLVPGAFSRVEASPNPFNPRTTIRFSLPGDGAVDLSVYDLRGSHLKTLATGHWDAGDHSLQWDGRDKSGRSLSSGTYLLRLRTGNSASSTKVTLTR